MTTLTARPAVLDTARALHTTAGCDCPECNGTGIVRNGMADAPAFDGVCPHCLYHTPDGAMHHNTTNTAKGEQTMAAQATAKAGIGWASLTDEQRERLNYEGCAHCGHTRQWHLWGDTCRKTQECQCDTFIGDGTDARQ